MNKMIFAAVVAVLGLSMTPAIAQISTSADSGTEAIAQVPSTTAVTPGGERFKRFQLTTEQLEKLHALKTQYATANSAKKAELKLLKGQLKDALTAVTVDKSSALSIQNKINSLKSDLANSRVSFMADASTVFTTEQREAMHRRALMGGGFGGHRGHGKGHGGCGGGGHHRGGHGGHGFHGKGGPGGPGGHAEGPAGPNSSASAPAPQSEADS